MEPDQETVSARKALLNDMGVGGPGKSVKKNFLAELICRAVRILR